MPTSLRDDLSATIRRRGPAGHPRPRSGSARPSRCARAAARIGALLALLLAAISGPAPSSLAAQVADLLISGVTLIDGTGAPPVEDAWVLVREGRIERVSREALEAPAGVREIDGGGRWLIPGLMDMHVHLQGGRGRDAPDETAGIRALHGFLWSGVTSVYDAGNDPDYVFGLRERERAGEIASPRVFASGGVVTAPGGHGGGPGATLIESWPADRPKLEAHAAREPDLVKLTFDEHGWGTRPLIPLLDPELMAEAGRFFNERGIRTTVHVSHEYRARQAIAAGINTLAHPVIQGPISDGFVGLMASSGTPMVSTLTIGEGYGRLVDHPEFLEGPLYQAVYEPDLIERLRTEVREAYAARPWTTWMKVMNPVAQENLRRIHDAGGVIVMGSDQSNGPASHRELELLVQGGIEPLDALRIGTLNGAVFLGMEDELGSVEEGKLADLVLLGSDPLADISNAADIVTVIKGGEVVDRSALDLPVNR